MGLRGLTPEAEAEMEGRWVAFHQRRRGNQVMPLVANVVPCATLAAARTLVYRRATYVLRHLSHADGLVLHGLFAALIREQQAVAGDPDHDARPALTFAHAVIAHLGLLLRPGRGWRRWSFPVTRYLPSPFLDASMDELVHLLQGCLEVMDEVGRPVLGTDEPQTPQTLDQMQSLYDFAAEWPCFMRDGVPLSWWHYAAGVGCLSRRTARAMLLNIDTGAIAQHGDDDRRPIRPLLRAAAGCN